MKPTEGVPGMPDEGYRPKCERDWGPYIFLIDGPNSSVGTVAAADLSGGDAASSPPLSTSAPADGWLTLREAAAKLHCSYCWLSRKWRDLGLRPSRAARQLLFNAEELEEFIVLHRIRRRGRPRRA